MTNPIEVRLIWTHAPGVERFTETTIAPKVNWFTALRNTVNPGGDCPPMEHNLENLQDCQRRFAEEMDYFGAEYGFDEDDFECVPPWYEDCSYYSADFKQRAEFVTAIDRRFFAGVSDLENDRQTKIAGQKWLDNYTKK